MVTVKRKAGGLPMFLRQIFKWLFNGRILFGFVLGLSAGVILNAYVSGSQTKDPAVIRAQRFELVDKTGHLLADFGPDRFYKSGIVSLDIFNKNGAFGIGLDPTGTSTLSMENYKEKTIVGIDSGARGAPPGILLRGKKTRIILTFRGLNGKPVIAFHDNNNNVRIWTTPR